MTLFATIKASRKLGPLGWDSGTPPTLVVTPSPTYDPLKFVAGVGAVGFSEPPPEQEATTAAVTITTASLMKLSLRVHLTSPGADVRMTRMVFTRLGAKGPGRSPESSSA